MKSILLKTIFLSTTLSLWSCNSDQTSHLKEAMDRKNDPTPLTSPEYIKNFSQLELKGRVTTQGWSDGYWPTYKGGIGTRWQLDENDRNDKAPWDAKLAAGFPLLTPSTATSKELNLASPAEKYDIARNDWNFFLLNSERERTKIMKTVPGSSQYDADFDPATWEGLCHGWAPASINFEEPKFPVVVPTKAGDMTFYPSDVKALLTYFQQYASEATTASYFVSERCEEDFEDLDQQVLDGKLTKEEVDARKNTPGCKDVNAATLHLVLANEIGKKKTSFIADVTRGTQVWNQAVNGYDSKVISKKLGASKGAASGTHSEVTIHTEMKYTVEVSSSLTANGTTEETGIYDYILELDKDGNIIGGRYVADEPGFIANDEISADRPDFLWRETTPDFKKTGFYKKLGEIYKKSIGKP